MTATNFLEAASVSRNGSFKQKTPLHRADEVDDLLDAVKSLIIPFIRAADEAAPNKLTGAPPKVTENLPKNVLVEALEPEVLTERLGFSLPDSEGRGKEGLLQTIQGILQYSVNTWDQGYLDKLCASTNAVGVVSELLISVLNTNVHVYHVSPALTVVEKTTARSLANLFGFTGPRAGGMTCQGGSSSNLTSMVIARGALYPETKSYGNGTHNFAIFTNVHGHYSIKKAAMTCGMGVESVVGVPCDSEGRMKTDALRDLVLQAKADGKTPLYVNATAGTTVYGSFEPFKAIHKICREFGMWMHVDGSWGGSTVFSAAQRHKLDGVELADSLTVNPHKMLNVPATCSFLLTNDTGVFQRANSTPAGYLFHGHSKEDDEVWDLADLTLQCGRRADSIKMALAWIYYGAAGFERSIDHAFDMAAHMANLIEKHPDFVLVSTNPPPSLQICFYYAPGGVMANTNEENTSRTSEMVERLVQRGFMIDYAPGDHGSFFRVVVNCQTLKGTVDGMVMELEKAGKEVVTQ